MQEAKRGDRVSLNPLKRLFYFQDGEGGIRLVSGQTDSAVIPDNATDNHLKQINHAIKAEQLVIGSPEVIADIPDRDSDIKAILEQGRNKIDEWIFNIRADKKIKNYQKIEIIEKLIEFEKSGKNRKSVLTKAEYSLKNIGGISPVTETEKQEVKISLTSGNEEV